MKKLLFKVTCIIGYILCGVSLYMITVVNLFEIANGTNSLFTVDELVWLIFAIVGCFLVVMGFEGNKKIIEME